MADSEKPFACPSLGCNMSFINEDHLTVHKKKHEMMLNLESANKNNVFIDQTPTPTRFIKNCEELGLFQDLQNVNPFEETFRRAVESGKTGTPSVSDTDTSDDVLHTPHIFPHITDCQTASSQIIHVTNTIDEMSSASAATVIDVTRNELLDNTRNDNNLPNENLFRPINKTSDIIYLEKRPKLDEETCNKVYQSSSQFLNINGEDVQLLLKTADGKLMQLTAIPISENVENRVSTAVNDRENFSTSLSSDEKLSTVVIKTNPPLECSQKLSSPKPSLAKLKLKQALSKGSNMPVDQSRRILTANDKEEDRRATLSKENLGKKRASAEQNKKQEIRERNRASSMRCRVKRKEWIQQLQQTISCANEKNAVLQLEIKNLHTEIARLKMLLLAHKDCPITNAMEKGKSILIAPNTIDANAEVIHLTQGTQVGVNSQLLVIPSTNSILTKKRHFITSPSPKHSVVLQKPENQTIQPANVKKINPIIKIQSGNLLEKQLKSKPNINNSADIINPLLKIDEIVMSNQICETRDASNANTKT